MEISVSVRLVSWAGWQLQSPLSVSCVSLSPRAGGGQETLLRTWQPHQQTSDTLVEEVKRGEWSPHQRSHSSEISVGYNQGPGPPVCLGSNFSVVSPTSRSTYLTPVGPSPHPPHLCTAAPARYETIENNNAREQNISQVRVSGKAAGQFLCV